jgi:hypothetical protein
MSAAFFKRVASNPWVIISAMGHAIVLAIISVVVMTQEAAVDDASATTVSIAEPPKDEPEVKPPEVVDRQDVPKLQDSDIRPNDLQEWIDTEEPVQADEELTDMPSGDTTGGSAIGIAGPGHHGLAPSATGGRRPGKFGSRFGGGPGGGRPGGAQTAQAVKDALIWLANHQDDDGRWDTANFMKHDVEGEPCDGGGRVTNDIGVTGLALLAFLGEGNTLRVGGHKGTVRKAVKWLQEQQDDATGLFGSESSHEYIYSHAIATLAMCEAYGLSEHPPLKKNVEKALAYIHRARNPYAVWRYYPADGNNDTSVTGWMVFALASAKDFGLTIDDKALESSAIWFDSVTDPTTGRAGYTKKGEGSSRPESLVDKFPSTKTESLTAVALL